MENITIEGSSANRHCLIGASSHIGGRSEQQDRAYICCDEYNAFVLLCDGMGGAVNGATASDTAITAMRQAYQEYLSDGCDDTPDSFLYHAMLRADRLVAESIGYKIGGTTMVAALLREDNLYWLSVGDSRLYILRSGELLQVTRDHNYLLRLNELKTLGEISDDQFRMEAERGEALISYIGLGHITLFDLTQTGFKLQRGDRLLLATDGLFKALSTDRMKITMEFPDDISARADSFIKQILTKGEKQKLDNTTLILIDAL